MQPLCLGRKPGKFAKTEVTGYEYTVHQNTTVAGMRTPTIP
jgi:hypothetical protein